MARFKLFLFLQFIFFSALPVLGQVDTAWVRRYNGFGNSFDAAYALAVDDGGNVYVTGYSVGNGTGEDYATIKFKPNGDTAWVRRYNGPENNSADRASVLAVDDSGNVYVTGGSYGTLSADDYATIKYKPIGDTAWVRRYDGEELIPSGDHATAMALDNAGNVYVTGISGNDYATIKYYPNGDTIWVRRYSASSGSAYALAIDDSGEVYVTGSSGTIKYSAKGDSLWFGVYTGTDLVIDVSGNVYVTGTSGSYPNYDYATIKYYPNGDTAWVRRYNGPGNNDDVERSLAVDDSGNVYVTGYSMDTVYLDYDYATIKYYPNGDTAWVRRYKGAGDFEDKAYALAVDDSGNVYVTGVSFVISTTWDYATIKYKPNGDTAWVRRYNGTGNSVDEAYALAVDDSDNVYVTGVSLGSGTSYDYATIKYNKLGCAARAGDANSDYKVNLTDIIFKVNYVFKGGVKPDPLCSGDDNADNSVNLEDIIHSVNFVFKGGPAPLKSLECCL